MMSSYIQKYYVITRLILPIKKDIVLIEDKYIKAIKENSYQLQEKLLQQANTIY